MAGVVIEMTAKDAQAIREYDKLIEKNKQLKDEIKDLQRASKEQSDGSAKGQREQQGMLAETLKSVTAVGLAYKGVATALEVARMTAKEFNEALQKANETAKGTVDSTKQLLQITSKDMPLEVLRAHSRNLVRDHGVSIDAAQQMTFDAASQGYLGELSSVGRAEKVLDVSTLPLLAGKVPKLFGGRISSMESINMGLVAAEQAEVNTDTMGRILPIAAEGLSATGATPAETFAAMSVFPDLFSTGNTSAERLKRFGLMVGASDLKDLSLVEQVKSLSAMSPEQQESILGASTAEAATAFRLLQGALPTIEQRASIIDSAQRSTGTADSPLNYRLGEMGRDALFNAYYDNRAAASMAEMNTMNRRGEASLRREQRLTEGREALSADLDPRASALGIALDKYVMSAVRGYEDATYGDWRDSPRSQRGPGPAFGSAEFFLGGFTPESMKQSVKDGVREGVGRSTMAAPDVDK